MADLHEAQPYDSIYWVEVERIHPNPYQPRKVFDEMALQSLSESIKQYGVLQPLVVTRKEIIQPGEGIRVEYELISGERRLRASKLAGLFQVPVVVRHSEDTDRMKLELAIIENLQREDLNPIDRAKAFKRLADEFGLKHIEIGKRVGKSREYVSNSLRILMLPQEMQDGLEKGDINEGHTRPLLMLIDRPEEQRTLFREIIERRLTVRDTEQLARRVAIERVRKTDQVSPDLINLEKQLTEKLGTRVRIEKKDKGGKVTIDFFSPEDLAHLCMVLATQEAGVPIASAAPVATEAPLLEPVQQVLPVAEPEVAVVPPPPPPAPKAEEKEADDLYSIRNFTV